MALSQRLELRQTQGLVMTPQLMQAIKLLQLSSLDLAAYVENELERNPLLERANDDDAPAAAAEAESNNQPAEGSEDGAANADWMGADLETSRSSMEQGLGTELENVFPDDGGEKPAKPETPEPAYSEWSGAGSAASGEDYNLEAFVSVETTLADHLAEQMALAISDPAGRMIGQYLIDMVDEAGYLTGDLDAVVDKLGARRSDVEACARGSAGLRSTRRMRAQSHRMPRHPAQGTRPLRSGHAYAGRASRPSREARSFRLAPTCAE